MTAIIGVCERTKAVSNAQRSEVATNQVNAMTFLDREVKPHSIYINKFNNTVAVSQDA